MKAPAGVASAQSRTKRRRRKKWLKLLLILALIAAVGAGGYYWRDKQAKTELDNKQSEISALNDKTSALEKELEEKKAEQEKAEKEAANKSSARTLDNIKASMNSGNTAALRGYMAPRVKVILAASEGLGDRTPSEAIEDLKYVENAAKPWDFALSASTLNSYRNGAYRQYFPSDAFVGRSTDNYVISFTFDNNGRINGIFIASDASLLL